MSKLTREEKEIEKAVLEGKYNPVPKANWGRYQNAAKETMKKNARKKMLNRWNTFKEKIAI